MPVCERVLQIAMWYLPFGDSVVKLAAFARLPPSQYLEEVSAAYLPGLSTTRQQCTRTISLT